MSFTELELESIRDHLRSCGFDLPDDWDNDRISLLAGAIVEALGLDALAQLREGK